MDDIFVVLAILLFAFVLAGPILALVAMSMISKNQRDQQGLRQQLDYVTKRLHALEQRLTEAQAKPEPSPPSIAPAPAPVVQTQTSTPSPSPAASAMSAAPAPEPLRYTPTPTSAAPSEPDDMERLEENLGKRWITWIGVLALFISVAYFVKLAIDYGWIGPVTQVSMGIAFGLIMLITGDRVIRRPMRALGEGLMGGGIAIIYVSLFAAYAFYQHPLISSVVAFTAMVLLTAMGMALAALHNAMVLNFLAVLGGFLTPLMVSSGQNSRDVLFTYLLLLDLGVVGVSGYLKGWRAVDALAFIGTWVLFAGWFSNYYTPAQLAPTLVWIGVFYLVFLCLPFIYHLHYRIPVTVERFQMALANAVIAFGYAYYLLSPGHRTALGFVALGMSATTLLMGSLTRRRLTRDATAIFGFIALSVAFLTLAIPLHLRAYGVSLAWAVEGPVLLYLGYRFRYRPVRVGGLLVLILSVFYLFVVRWPLHTIAFTPIANRHFLEAMAIAAIFAAYAVIGYLWRDEATLEDRVMTVSTGIAAGLLALFLLQEELSLWFTFTGREALTGYLRTVIWTVGGCAFVVVGIQIRNLAVMVVGAIPLLIAGVIGMLTYSDSHAYTLAFNPRFGSLALLVLVLFSCWWLAYRRQNPPEFQQFLFGYFEVALFLLCSLEACTWGESSIKDMEKAHWIAQMSLSITWGLYAIALLVAGFWRRSRGMRLSALALFGITALKLVIVDLSTLSQIYRIISFFVLGLLMIGASYLYHHIEKRLVMPAGEES